MMTDELKTVDSRPWKWGVRQLQFRKEADRSVDKLIFHTTLFDRDGKYLTAKEGSLDLHAKDATLERLVQSGSMPCLFFNGAKTQCQHDPIIVALALLAQLPSGL